MYLKNSNYHAVQIQVPYIESYKKFQSINLDQSVQYGTSCLVLCADGHMPDMVMSSEKDFSSLQLV